MAIETLPMKTERNATTCTSYGKLLSRTQQKKIKLGRKCNTQNQTAVLHCYRGKSWPADMQPGSCWPLRRGLRMSHDGKGSFDRGEAGVGPVSVVWGCATRFSNIAKHTSEKWIPSLNTFKRLGMQQKCGANWRA